MTDTQKLEVENYEHNLKLHYDAKRKELDILLQTSIPRQLTNMKTLLWINLVLMGFISHLFKDNMEGQQLIIGFFILSVFAIVIILIAMLTSRSVNYGVSDNTSMMQELKDDVWTKSIAIGHMLCDTQKAIEENRDTIVKRGELMHIATWFTFFALSFSTLIMSIYKL